MSDAVSINRRVGDRWIRHADLGVRTGGRMIAPPSGATLRDSQSEVGLREAPPCATVGDYQGNGCFGLGGKEGNELVHIGIAGSVFCGAYRRTREGWSRARQFKLG
jgi:hypothetical protein